MRGANGAQELAPCLTCSVMCISCFDTAAAHIDNTPRGSAVPFPAICVARVFHNSNSRPQAATPGRLPFAPV